jgi:WD40 repeat protein
MSSTTGVHQPALKLERAIGLTSLNNSSFCSSATGDLYYAAGCFVVRYNPEENKQKGFYKASKAVASIAVSKDGHYLAIGERGQSPLVTVWNVERFEIISTLSHHKHGISCVDFSPDGRYLVSVGFKLDRQLVLWDWRTSSVVTTHKLGNRVHAIQFHESGEYFITAGDRHLKWWMITEVIEGESVVLEGKAASILEDMRNSVFMDVVCGSGRSASLVYSTTSTGVLCLFNAEKMVEKWVQLESSSSYCLELIPAEGAAGLLVVGCANGTVRCFDPLTLQYVATLPLPAPLVGALPKASRVDEGSEVHHLSTHAPYAACYGVRKVRSPRSAGPPKLATIYGDRSLFVWNISDLYAIAKYRSFQFHRACIWDVQFVDAVGAPASQVPALPVGTFVTCSADNTLRFWNTDQRMQRESRHRSPFSREMLHCIDLLADVFAPGHDAHNTSVGTVDTRPHHDKGHEPPLNSSVTMLHFLQHGHSSGVEVDVCEGIPDFEMPDRPQSQYSPRALAVHPYGHQLACGDKMGTLLVFDIRGMRQLSATPAHTAEVLTLSYSPVMVQDSEGAWSLRDAAGAHGGQEEAVLLASAGRDRLIHVFNASQNYAPIHTLDHHTSSVTVAKFTSDGRRLLTCGGDRTIAFSSVDGPTVKYIRSVTTPHGSINGLAVEASNKFAVTSGQDKRLNIWNLERCKHMRAYRSEHVHSELYKSDIDPSGRHPFFFCNTSQYK